MKLLYKQHITMRKFILSLLTGCMMLLAGCLETSQEITLYADGSGLISNTNDFSAIMGIAKQMGGTGEIEKMAGGSIDSTISMKDGADSIPNLLPEERDMVRKGTLKIKMDLKEDKFLTNLSFPFSSPSQIDGINKLSAKLMTEALKDKMGEETPIASNELKESSSFDDYYTLDFSHGELTKKVNKAKYADLSGDEYLKSLKDAASNGMAMKATYIINLPRPATKAEGKNVKLSGDKKKVTISADIEDFYEDPAAFEFKIKY